MSMFARHADLVDLTKLEELHVTICGCGTVGSNAAVQLAKLGVGNFTLYDMDTVDWHNLASQEFDLMNRGNLKVESLRERLLSLNKDLSITLGDELYGGEVFDAGIIILAVDSMDMRKLIYESSCKNNPSIAAMMDFRMGGPNMQSWTINPCDEKDQRRYESTLYSSGETVALPCGGRTFAPVGALSGSIAANAVGKITSEGKSTPFYTVIDLDSMSMTTAGTSGV